MDQSNCHFTYSPYVGNSHASGAATYGNAQPAAPVWIALEFPYYK